VCSSDLYFAELAERTGLELGESARGSSL
jgi:hypothetical protein